MLHRAVSWRGETTMTTTMIRTSEQGDATWFFNALMTT
jgi:hypothetical protein